MKSHAAYWAHIQKAFTQIISGDQAALAELNALVDAVRTSQLQQQHKPMSRLFSILGGIDAAHELGFRFGTQIPITAYGGLSLGVRIAPTFRDALKLIVKYHHGETPLVLYSYQESKTEGRLMVGFRCPIESRGEALLVSAVVSAVDAELLRITGKKHHIKRIELNLSSKGWESLYQKHLLVRPEIDHGVNAIVFDKETLDLPNSSADIGTFNEMIAEYERDQLLYEVPKSIVLQTTEQIMSRISDPPTIDCLAKFFGLSPRRLRSTLSREGTSYREIVRNCRVEYAAALLRNPASSISDVAFRLGFIDLSAFTHNFQRWTSLSPSSFRRNITAKTK